MYNYRAPGQFPGPPGYTGFPPAANTPPGMAPPPGMGPPPGMAPPGVSPAPGILPAQNSLPTRPGALPSFQPPAGLPANFNPNAPIIRLGTSGPPKSETPGRKDSNADGIVAGPKRGLGSDARGMDPQRAQMREQMAPLVPPSKEEIARTIFVSNITDGVGGDEGLERILRTAGSLRRWTRCTDADNKPCSFGFAEYEDAESLETAVEIFKEVEVPVEKQVPKPQKEQKEDEEEKEIKKANLNIVIDEASVKYAEEWKSRRNEDEASAQFRVDTSKEQLDSVLRSLFNPILVDASGDAVMQDDIQRLDGIAAAEEFVPFKPAAPEDELADIPAEMRETVAAEIAAFRERSNRRDIERAKREEELETAERQRNLGGIDRLGAPTGPGGANGIPLGPRAGVQGAPSGPRGFQGVQVPKDYQGGVNFVNGTGYKREDEDDPASDGELERRRIRQKDEEKDKVFFEQERRWVGRERTRAAAVERQKASDTQEEATLVKEKEATAKRLKEWNDDTEASRGTEEYYRDRSLWIRTRAAFRKREARLDEMDRMAEEREKAEEQEKRDQARGMADSFLERQAQELEAKVQPPQGPQRFKMSLGAAAAQKAQATTAPRRTIAEIEGLLEDEEEASATTKRTLIPIKFDTAAETANMSDEERAQAQRQLAASIPESTEDLWNWDIKWDCVDDHIITEKLEPFIEKKIMDSLGVQDQWLVEMVTELLRKRSTPQKLIDELSQPLDEEAEGMVKKLWRLLIFFSESEKRGLPY